MLYVYNNSYNYFLESYNLGKPKLLYIKNNYCYIINITRDIFMKIKL